MSLGLSLLMTTIAVGLCGLLASGRFMSAMCAFIGINIALGGVYLLVGAHFVAAVQWMLYVGGVLVLMCYAFMLSRSNEFVEGKVFHGWKLVLALGVFVIFWIGDLDQAPLLLVESKSYADVADNFHQLGLLLISRHGVLLELVGLLLLVALMGGVRLLGQGMPTPTTSSAASSTKDN